MALTLVIGNKNYSSWSLRPWIALRAAGIDFAEEVIPLYQPGSRQRILKYSPAGKLPVLIDGDMIVWESLAILEHLAEKFPAAGLWPKEEKARAHARAVAAEMHAGFPALRQRCPMNMRRPVRERALTPEAEQDAQRIDAVWSDCRARFGQKADSAGPFLFGAFGAADAMYAPVVARFATYALKASAAARQYIDAVTGLPAWQEWRAAALAEPWILSQDEVD